MGPLRFMAAGNFSRMISIRHGTIAFHLHRKLSAYGFLSGMAPLRFTSAGNFYESVKISFLFGIIG